MSAAQVDEVSLSFAGRAHARWIVVAGDNPREKCIQDAAFGHYGITAATVSFEHEYSDAPEIGAELATDYADRLVACANALKGIADPRAFRAAIAELIAACNERNGAEEQYYSAEILYGENSNHDDMRASRLRMQKATKRYVAALARIGGAQ